jgi:predicted metal-dependent HD superfamily phosphohydrolase
MTSSCDLNMGSGQPGATLRRWPPTEAGIEFDRVAVEHAAWFPRRIYEIARDDNEDRSAELGRELLSSSPIRDDVARLVLVTKTHNVSADDVNGAVLSDADLSVLGSEPLQSQGGRPRAVGRTRPP